MLKIVSCIFVVILAVGLISSVIAADVPRAVNYQGRLTDGSGSPAADGTYQINFKIYGSETGNDSLWWSGFQSVSVTNGLFSYRLGSSATLPDSIFANDSARFLGVTVGTDSEISPRTKFLSVGYAYQALHADTASVALSGPVGQGGWSDDGTSVRLTTSTDQVGIGVSSPTEKLDIDGNIKVSGTIQSGNSIIIDGVNDRISSTNGSIELESTDLESSEDIRLGNTAAIEDSIKLGIRIPTDSTLPFIKLYTETSSPSDLTHPVFQIYNPSYNYTPLDIVAGGALIQRNQAKSDGVIATKISPDTSFFVGGPVGIGTKTPGELLEVNGVIHSTAGGFRFPDGTVQNSAADGGITGVYGIDGLEGGGSSGDINLSIKNNGVTGDKIEDGTITNGDISDYAHIEPSKIGGVAATWTASNSFEATNTFNGDVIVRGHELAVFDSDLVLGNMGSDRWRLKDSETSGLQFYQAYANNGDELNISRMEIGDQGNIGINNVPLPDSRLNVKDSTDSPLDYYGIYSDVHRVTGTGGTVHGIYGQGVSFDDDRTGVEGRAFAPNSAGATGISYGVKGYAEHGSQAYGGYFTVYDATFKAAIYATTMSTYGDYAGFFWGNVVCSGTINGSTGAIKIDHPLDPSNKFLLHSNVQSPDMMNVYNGNVILDEKGEAVVEMPSYFEALNSDFRYQLTCIGGFAPVYVADEISDGRFVIAGGEPGMKVSWQVTGIRADVVAKAHRLPVEVEKSDEEKGLYIHHELFGFGFERSINKIHEDVTRLEDRMEIDNE